MRPVGSPSTAKVKLMTQTSSLSHHPPVSYIWTKVMTDECTNFSCNSHNNGAYLWVHARCNEKQPEGINDDQITEKGKLNHHRCRQTHLHCQKTMVSVLMQLQALPAGPHVWQMMTWSFEAGWELHTTWAQVCLAQPIPETQTLLAHGGKNDCKSK